MPEVETLRRQLEPLVTGQPVLDVLEGTRTRFAEGHLIRGVCVRSVGRRGKYLLLPTDDGREILIHLGMTGQLLWGSRPDTHAHLGLVFPAGSLWVRDPRRFGQVRVLEEGRHESIPTLHRLGPEPDDPSFDPARVTTYLSGEGSRAKATLLAQEMVAGIGNYLADESLWWARIHPSAHSLTVEEAARLHSAVRWVVSESLSFGGVSERDYVHLDGSRGSYQDHLRAHGRGGFPCVRCGDRLEKSRIAGRGTVWCPRCQVPPEPGRDQR